ncbi:MAG: protein-glutamate O-methyltransferase CheR, partial [Armatimonadetes bacterium]|nr:protein-glutamate O-methyltransferase CheR [Armatimonadota bacterium]
MGAAGRRQELLAAPLDLVASLVERHSGIVIEETHRAGLRSAIAARVRATACGDLYAYLRLLRQPESGETQQLIEALAIPETRFFRNQGHFRVLRDVVLPALARDGRPVRIWSAGCSTGEEAYSLVIACLEAGSAGSGYPVAVLATDISRSALRTAAEGHYSEREMAGVSESLRRRYFELRDDRWHVKPRVRAAVTLACHNLTDPDIPVPLASMDLVFCQNVTIYFRAATTRSVALRLASALREGGYLFPGFSETMWQAAPGLSLVSFGDCFVYRKGARAHESAGAWEHGSAGDRSRASAGAQERRRASARSTPPTGTSIASPHPH